MDAVLGIFDADKAYTIEFSVRLEAAEALGQAGDPRLRQDNWVTIRRRRSGESWCGGHPGSCQQAKSSVTPARSSRSRPFFCVSDQNASEPRRHHTECVR